jgi:hypothetical protein
MKIEEFKKELRSGLAKICAHNRWSFDNAKHRGMAFENWCFDIFCERYPTAENDPNECIIRGDDAGIDIFFESKETEEVYLLQCKHPKIAQSDPIPEDELKSFFSNYDLLRDKKYQRQRQTSNPKIQELQVEFDFWNRQGLLIYFIFISSGKLTDKAQALIDKQNRDYEGENVKFAVWDISTLRDEHLSIKSIEERYPDEITLSLADNHYMQPGGDLESITFVAKGTTLQQLAHQYKDSLFNWNIRRVLG